MEKKLMNHFCHEHPLILTKQVSDDDDDVKSDLKYCYACGEAVTNLEWAYVCDQHKPNCRLIILHSRCGELPRRIFSYPSHPQHPLHLFDYRNLLQICSHCSSELSCKLGYRCPSCEFDIHIECRGGGIDESLKKRRELQHPSHVHPLTLMRKPAFSFTCDGCGTQDVDTAYICSTCEYWLHESCALSPVTLPVSEDHPHHHQLSLAFCFPMEHRKYRYKCDVCDKDFDMSCWLYFCGYCRFFVHPKCVGSSSHSDDHHVISSCIWNDGSGLIQFPLKDVSKELITPFVMRERGVDDDVLNNLPATVKMPETTASYSFLFNYHKHPLCLVSVEEDLVEKGEEEVELMKICNLCITPIYSPPYYKCPDNVACNYFVHSICYLLPKTLSPNSPNYLNLYVGDCSYIRNKNHKFTLCTGLGEMDKNVWIQWCMLCHSHTNGMVYKCEGCSIKVDVKCASLPTTMRHASHPHHKHLTKTILPETRDKWRECYGCGYYHYHPSIVYLCSSSDEGCDFGLCLNCVLLPPSIDNRDVTGDKHPLLLTYDASIDHPDDFCCVRRLREGNASQEMDVLLWRK